MILSMLSKSTGAGRGLLRGLAILGVLLVWLVLAGLGGTSIGRLSEVQENDAASFLPAGAEATRAAEEAVAFRDTSTLPALVVVTGDGELTGAQVGAVQAWAEGIAAIELPDGSAVGDVLTAPTVAIPSQDGEAVLVAVSLDAT
ncbi:MAG TPA: hypothetical protein PLS68_12990, partial [Actinotalea sp.]|nr:hypothetical protein [Actinotalea sp.]